MIKRSKKKLILGIAASALALSATAAGTSIASAQVGPGNDQPYDQISSPTNNTGAADDAAARAIADRMAAQQRAIADAVNAANSGVDPGEL